MTDWEMIIADCFDVPPYQLPPVRLIKGQYVLDVMLWGREFCFSHTHLTVVLREYTAWVKQLHKEAKEAQLQDLSTPTI